jgi:lipopolysaccharide export system permease protein
MAKMILENNVTFVEVFRIVTYIAPSMLVMTIPVSIFVASVIGFNQFSSSSEFDAMKASGFSFAHKLKPVLILGFLAYIACSIIIFYALPWGNQSFKNIILTIVKTRADIGIKPKVFNTKFKNVTIYAKEKNINNTYKDIFVADNSSSDFSKVILSKKGVIGTDPDNLTVQLRLNDGTIHDQSQKGKSYKLLKFDKYSITLTFPSLISLKDRIFVGNKELSYSDLRQKITSIKDPNSRKAIEFKISLSRKFSLPLTCVLFAMLGAPLGITSRRSGKSGAYLLSAVGILSYYVLLNAMINLATIGKLNPYLSVWIPNIILFAIAYFVVRKVHKEIPFNSFNKIIDVFLDGYDFILGIINKLPDKNTSITKRNPASTKS